MDNIASSRGWTPKKKFSQSKIIISVLGILLVLSVGFNAFMTTKYAKLKRQSPEKVTVKVPVEKIKYVKSSGLKTPTVELIAVLNSKLDPQLSKIIAEHVEKASTKYGLPVPLVLSVIRKESNYNPLAVSKAGAVGLMQVMPKIHKDKYKGRNLYHIATNIDVGCQIIREYLDREGTLDKMFHAYLSKNASKDAINKYRNDIKNFWVKLEMHDYENDQESEDKIVPTDSLIQVSNPKK